MGQDKIAATSAYERMVRDDSAAVYRLAYRMCGNPDIAEELTQEAFYEAWKSIGSLKHPSSSKSWLVSILRHRYYHWLRRQKRHPETPVSGNELLGILDGRPRQHQYLTSDLLQSAIDRLDTDSKETFLLYLEGFKCREIAEMLDLPLGTVLTRVYRSRAFLQGRLLRELADLNIPEFNLGDA